MDNTKNYIVGVDFGAANLVMAVGSLDEQGTVKVEALLSRPTEGNIEMGVIQNVKFVCDQLRDMKREIEEELGIRIDEAYASVSGAYIHYHSYSDHVFVADTVKRIVAQADVDALNERMNRVTVPEDEEIIDRFPLNYMIDQRRETENPVGSFSGQLSSTFAFIIGKRQPLSRIQMVFNDAGLRLAGIFANSAIMADAVLSAEEKNDGVAVADIGADTTDVAIYSGGVLRYAATIPMGGHAIDSDINKHGVTSRYIETLKKQCGTALSETVSEKPIIKIPTSGKNYKTVLKRNLASIIEARLLDIIEYVKAEIKDSGYDGKLPYGLVLTGGTAAIPDIDKLFMRHTERDVRVAMATEGIDKKSSDKIDSPEYTAVIALLAAGAAKGCCDITVTGPGQAAKQNTAQPQHTESEVPKEKEKKPFEPTKSKATTYQPPQRPEYKVPERPARPEQPKPPVATPPTPPSVPEPEPEPVQEPKEEQPEKKQQDDKQVPPPPKPPKQPKKKRWGFGTLIDSLNGIFQEGGDTPLSDLAEMPAEHAKEVSEPKPAHEPRPVQHFVEPDMEQQPPQVDEQPAEAPRTEQPKRSTFSPKKMKIDIAEFFVEGEDKEEI